jgi:hypothetical protein
MSKSTLLFARAVRAVFVLQGCFGTLVVVGYFSSLTFSLYLGECTDCSGITAQHTPIAFYLPLIAPIALTTLNFMSGVARPSDKSRRNGLVTSAAGFAVGIATCFVYGYYDPSVGWQITSNAWPIVGIPVALLNAFAFATLVRRSDRSDTDTTLSPL